MSLVKLRLVIAIHGILTSQTEASWPDKFNSWCFHHAPELNVLKKEYKAGPFPRWNVWVKDPIVARSLTNEILEFCSDDEGSILETRIPDIWFVCHSNGCVIGLLTMKRLIARGIPVAGCIFTGGACDAVVERNGIWQWINAGKLGKAVAFSAHDDAVVRSKLIWPYGHLGATGWQCLDSNGQLVAWHKEDKAWTEWFTGYGHSGYFNDANRVNTFERFAKIINSSGCVKKHLVK